MEYKARAKQKGGDAIGFSIRADTPESAITKATTEANRIFNATGRHKEAEITVSLTPVEEK